MDRQTDGRTDGQVENIMLLPASLCYFGHIFTLSVLIGLFLGLFTIFLCFMGSFDLYVHYKGHLCYLGYFWPILMS